MNRYEIGFNDCFFGVYHADTMEDAIANCKQDLKVAKMWTTEYAVKDNLNQWIVNLLSI